MLKRFGPGALIAVGVLVLLAAIGYGAYAEALANPGAAAVPDAVAGARLAQKTVGPEAVAEVTRLHGKEFPLTSGAMATYGSGTATLWVTGVPASPMAAEMVRAMTNKIAEGRSPFTPTKNTREINGRAVYELSGMGQRHFYFQSGSLVIWLAADEAIAEKALMETLTFYP
ncbi:MAG TPA: hypothetical protein VJL59_12760 [Anaerolineales bacterium]|nr:hypothetical protein [Anaerolineales bacterium]